ncbi:FAD-dependent oxidoreductase [Breoghania sp.]|uniref:FAD-dependent oxidoreductase n=1 Tax=Breoghania sp. TaxID=2065378 RepID=UPI002AA79489|nr:FAD-dependent oxidoreductase [Breoghania sp.]
MTPCVEKVLVVGGGFSGMTAAIELDRAGIQVDLVETDPHWRTDGAGISLHGATLRVFRQIGIYDEFLESGGGANGFDIIHPVSDETLFTLPTPVVGDVAFGNGGVMRPVLANILRQRVRETATNVRLGVTFTKVTPMEGGAQVEFSDGTSGVYDLIVGADGVNSALRSALWPEADAPAYVGQGVWRAVVDWPQELERPGMWAFEDLKVGINFVSPTKGYIFLTEPRPTLEHLDPTGFVEYLRALLKRFPSALLNRIADSLTEDSQVLYRPLFALLLPKPWSRQRCVLIGDAVHATTPHLAAGACAAMEDAVVLAEELSAAKDLAAGLEAYENRRFGRCEMIVNNSRRLCDIETSGGDRAEHSRIMQTSMGALAEAI